MLPVRLHEPFSDTSSLLLAVLGETLQSVSPLIYHASTE